ncbi:MAG: hypothetical protein KDE47_29680, partial [Caldilineaceae bacterium]|nr:hypothetical protein [Caldilineaceae bacterium]
MQDVLNSVILNSYPNANDVISLQSYRPNYLPYPARVTLRTIDGNLATCVLKGSEDEDKVLFEANVLQALTELGLAAPKVLAAPVTIQSDAGALTVLLTSELSGQPLPWIQLSDLNAAHQTCQLVHEAVDALHALTPRLKAHAVAALLPSVTLEAELQKIFSTGGQWLEEPIFVEALALLKVTLPRFSSPLVFSNGD